MDIFAFPLRFDDGEIRKLEDSSDDYYSQLLTLTMLTEPHTHPITPEFGVLDPTFKNIEKTLFITQAARFVPEIQITNIEVNLTNPDEPAVSFGFRKR